MTGKQLKYYITDSGKSPFLDWLKQQDRMSIAIVGRTLRRVAQGGAKKSIRCLKRGVFELKIPRGPGYRIYFGEDGGKLIILLCGGDKKTQTRDIERAREYWRKYGKSTRRF